MARAASIPSLGPCCSADCPALGEIEHLEHLLADPANANNISGGAQKEFIAAFLAASAKAAHLYEQDPLLKGTDELTRGGALLGCLFDLCTNLEYVVRTNWPDSWLSCAGAEHPATSAKLDAEDTEEPLEPLPDDPSLPEVQDALEGSLSAFGSIPAARSVDFEPRYYFSFLRACPRCSYHWGHIPPVPGKAATGNFSPHIKVTGHKPTSGPLGDITSGLMALLVQVLLRVNGGSSFDAKYVTKQNHPIDLVMFSPQHLVAAETKASPLVTYPIAADGSRLAADHADKNAVAADAVLSLYVPHRDWEIELGPAGGLPWPFDAMRRRLKEDPGIAVQLVSSWYQLFLAYQVPKRLRRTKVQRLSYLTNGWGDNTDSNKTKAGLGRSDDMKKGTYQMLHFGTLLKDRCVKHSVLVALLANMDPVNMYAEYLQPLQDAVWTVAEGVEDDGTISFPADRVHRLYDGILTFNRMHPADGPLAEPLSLSKFWTKIQASGAALASVAEWASDSP